MKGGAKDRACSCGAAGTIEVADELRPDAAATVGGRASGGRRCFWDAAAAPELSGCWEPLAHLTAAAAAPSCPLPLQVAALKRMGVEPIMLSGDARPTALAMAAAVGIPPEVRSNLRAAEAVEPSLRAQPSLMSASLGAAVAGVG